MKPKVTIDNEVYRKIMHWVNKSQYEVSGLGTVILEKDGTIRVTGAMLLPQKNGPTHTDIEADAVCKALYELRNSEGEVKFWWHSHVQMPVFWSGTDHQAMKDFASTPDSWMVCTVFNQKNELRSAYYSPDGVVTPWGNHVLFYDELETKVESFIEPMAATWDAEYDHNVTNASSRWVKKEVEVNGNTKQLSRKERKRLARQEKAAEQVKVVQAFELDERGFDQEERGILTEAGYTDQQIADLMDRDFNAAQILLLAEANLDYETVVYMLDDLNQTPGSIIARGRSIIEQVTSDYVNDDLPVADRRWDYGGYRNGDWWL